MSLHYSFHEGCSLPRFTIEQSKTNTWLTSQRHHVEEILVSYYSTDGVRALSFETLISYPCKVIGPPSPLSTLFRSAERPVGKLWMPVLLESLWFDPAGVRTTTYQSKSLTPYTTRLSRPRSTPVIQSGAFYIPAPGCSAFVGCGMYEWVLKVSCYPSYSLTKYRLLSFNE